jgi:hypothetical protein
MVLIGLKECPRKISIRCQFYSELPEKREKNLTRLYRNHLVNKRGKTMPGDKKKKKIKIATHKRKKRSRKDRHKTKR